jgi:hypothetical protein
MRAELEGIARGFSDCRRCRGFQVEDHRRRGFSALAMERLPRRIRVLFLAESPPQRTKNGKEPYFFRDESRPEHGRSTIFWALAEVLGLAKEFRWDFEWAKSHRAESKSRLLGEFMDRGYWLVDAAKCAVNGVASQSKRDQVLHRCCETWTSKEVRLLDPEGIVVIKTSVWPIAKPLIRSWGLSNRLLNEQPIPYPNQGHQRTFHDRMQALIRANPRLFP